MYNKYKLHSRQIPSRTKISKEFQKMCCNVTWFNSTCCVRTTLFVAFLLGTCFYILERRQDVWFSNLTSLPNLTTDETFQSSAGAVNLPILYYNGSLVGAFYLVDPIVAQSLLPKSMEPLTLPIIGKAIAGIFMFEYRNTSIGEYSEMGLTIQAKKKGSNDSSLFGYVCDMISNIYHLHICEQKGTGLYVSTLPVTTASAKAAGLEIWGYNKYVAGIKSRWQNDGIMKFQLTSEFTYALDSLGGSPYLPSFTMSGLPFLTYSEHSGRIMRTRVHVGHKITWGGSSKLQITGKGPTSNRMSKLKLDKLSPIAVFRTDSLQAHLPRGEYVD